MISSAYAAGLFDGEGCIQIRRLKQTLGTGRPGYVLTTTISMTDTEPLKAMQARFGGSLGNYDLRNSLRHKSIWLWTLYGATSVCFLRATMPWLMVKRRRAQIAIQYQRLVRKKARGPTPLSALELKRRDRLYDRMRLLNRRGVA
jgi:hypothetical protein